jgi:hypothetical protein
MIRRRHLIYVEGYDPQGAEGYHDLFLRSWRRFLKVWPINGAVSRLTLDSEDLAHWSIEASAPNWQVSTRYDFIRQEQFIRSNMAEPMRRQVPRALWWILNYLFTGTIVRVSRASWRYGAALIYFQLLMLLWLTLACSTGWLMLHVTAKVAAGPWPLHVALGTAGAIVCFHALRPLANRLFTVQINNHWPYLLEFARGLPTCFDRPIEAGARHLLATARANEVDEIVVVGHSGGGVIAPALMTRALELDPDLGRHGPRVVLLTPGSLLPGIGLHPRASRVRAVVERLAVEPSIRWIDVQARGDVLNFWNIDPVEDLGVHVGARRHNPVIWKIRMRDMVSPEFYGRLRWNLFRMHYQFIMANDRRAAYDYFMLVCGPIAVEEWTRPGQQIVDAFAPDATYRPALQRRAFPS